MEVGGYFFLSKKGNSRGGGGRRLGCWGEWRWRWWSWYWRVLKNSQQFCTKCIKIIIWVTLHTIHLLENGTQDREWIIQINTDLRWENGLKFMRKMKDEVNLVLFQKIWRWATIFPFNFNSQFWKIGVKILLKGGRTLRVCAIVMRRGNIFLAMLSRRCRYSDVIWSTDIGNAISPLHPNAPSNVYSSPVMSRKIWRASWSLIDKGRGKNIPWSEGSPLCGPSTRQNAQGNLELAFFNPFVKTR